MTETKILRFISWGVPIAALALALHLLFPPHWVRPANAQITGISPVITVTSVTSSPALQIVAYNPSRRSIEICSSQAITVAPVNPAGMAVVTPTSSIGIPIAAGGCFLTPANLLASGTAAGGGAAWQAIAVSTTANVSVLEY